MPPKTEVIARNYEVFVKIYLEYIIQIESLSVFKISVYMFDSLSTY